MRSEWVYRRLGRAITVILILIDLVFGGWAWHFSMSLSAGLKIDVISLFIGLPIVIGARRIPGGPILRSMIMLAAAVAVLGITQKIAHRNLIYVWRAMPSDGGSLTRTLTDGAAFGGTQLALVAMGETAFSLVSYFYILRTLRWNPDFPVIAALIALLRRLHSSPASLNRTGSKAAICKRLEYLAVYFEQRFPARLALSDQFARAALQKKCDSGAAYLRDLQVRVALSDGSTLQELRNDVARHIAIIVLGSYGSLPHGTPRTSKPRRSYQLASLCRTLLVAAIPICSIIGARYAGLRLTHDFGSWAIAAALIWAAISIIPVIDPMYKIKMQDFNSILRIARGADADK